MRFVTASDDMFVRVWDVRTGKALAEHAVRLPGDEVLVTEDGAVETKFGGGQCPWMSSDASVFILMKADKVLVYDVLTGKVARELPRWIANSRFQSISPDGKYFLAGHQGATVKLPDGRWHRDDDVLRLIDLSTGKPVRMMSLGSDVPHTAIFSPDGRYAALQMRVAGAPVRIFRVATLEQVLTIKGYDAYVWSLAFSADNRLLVSGLGDTTALVWDIAEATREVKE